MSVGYLLVLGVLAVSLTLAAYVTRIYAEMGRFLGREFQETLDAWEREVEPRLRLGRESIAISASLLRQVSWGGLALLFGLHLFRVGRSGGYLPPTAGEVAQGVVELLLLLLVYDRLLPHLLVTRTRGRWVARVWFVLDGLLLLVQPLALVEGLMLSIAALAEPEEEEEEHPSEAMEALLEKGEEEGIFEEGDRELVRSVVEFGDKMVREVMTPRPEIFAVPGEMTLEGFTAAIQEHAFSRVPVFAHVLDEVTGIAFAHDLLQVPDVDAGRLTVAEMQRPAAFVPETKNVAELLREMQREKQHMRLVIDEYGGVAGLVTIEDLLEAIVGEIADEHDTAEDQDEATVTAEGDVIASGGFEVSRLRDVLLDRLRKEEAEGEQGAAEETDGEEEQREERERMEAREDALQRLADEYDATTVGGMVSEISGHIPFAGEVVERDGLRFEVLEARNRRIARVKVSMVEASRE